MTKQRWPFQATTEDKRIIDAINVSRHFEDDSVAGGIRYALRFTSEHDEEIAMDETAKAILYQYAPDDASLFGADAELENIDIEASYNAYDNAVLVALGSVYPNALVRVQGGPDIISVNGMTDHGEVPWVEGVVHRVWESFSWIVTK